MFRGGARRSGRNDDDGVCVCVYIHKHIIFVCVCTVYTRIVIAGRGIYREIPGIARPRRSAARVRQTSGAEQLVRAILILAYF